jgi:acyl-CoA synthetase (AMP-forming)/AMP-acid ligase II
MEKSKFALVVMFAILKAGAAFVPMDPAQPVHALSVIVKEVDAKVVLCSGKTVGLFETQNEFATLVVDRIPEEGEQDEASDNDLPQVRDTDAAFIMFTVCLPNLRFVKT